MVLGFSLFIAIFLTACNKKMSSNTDPSLSAKEKRERNIREGRGASLRGLVGGRSGTNYEFSSSNPMWRASLETLDFLPLTTVDYSGGMIITDWYSDTSSNKESIKISLRFLGNDIRAENLKVIVHKKTCNPNLDCKVNLLGKTKIKERLIKFISDWTSHNKNLQASFELPYNRFIVVALNENLQNASGCSIDALMNLIQILEKEFDLILLDRMNVLYRDKSKNINYLTLKDFVKMVKSKSINSKTTVFNNLVTNKEEYMNSWEVPAIDSWHSRYFKIKK